MPIMGLKLGNREAPAIAASGCALHAQDVCESVKTDQKWENGGGDGLRPTMGLEGGPGAWWRTRMLPPLHRPPPLGR